VTCAQGPRKALPLRGPSRVAASRALGITLVLSALAALAAGPAWARSQDAAAPAAAGAPANAPATCVVHSLPSFISQGELEQAATVADVIEVECNPYVYGTGSKIKVSVGQLFSRCNGRVTWYLPNPFTAVPGARGVTLELDADGNATVALLAGPGCQAGESLVTAHMEEEPFETFTTAFTVLPPVNTQTGVFALPGAQVEDARSSAAAAVIQVEFAGGSEKKVRIASEELFRRCRVAPHLHWVRMDGTVLAGVPEVNGLELDNNGNAFVIAIGDASCAEGSSLIEADLESKPFTTLTTTFTVQPPQPTAEASFAIEKRQEIAGSGAGFTTAPLTGVIGQTVDYEIIVTNTAGVAETLSEFTDPHCDPGTIAGGPGSSALAAGASTTYTCSHVLDAVGIYTNEATVTGTTTGGKPVTRTSNQVLVEVPRAPGFTIEKLQQISGSATGFTTAPLTGAIGQTVQYEMIVKNTGSEPLAFSSFTDARCDPGTLAGGPGEALVAARGSTTYTCSHVLNAVGTYTNEAAVTGTPPGEAPITHVSNQVEVVVPGPNGAFFVVEKLQRIAGSGAAFTTAPLTGAIGQTVEYEIVVINTGKEPVTVTNFSDPHCDAGTIAGGQGETPLPPGSSTTYTCSHVLTSAGAYTNEAVVTATAPGEPPLTQPSNKVEVSVPAAAVPVPGTGVGPAAPKIEVKPRCEVSPPVLRGASGPKSGKFVVQVRSAGLQRATFYLDGRKLKTFTQAQAKRGKFTLTVNARRLSYGTHKVSLRTVASNPNCASVARNAVFVHPRPPRPLILTG
jgi:hypothetical protein